MDLGLAGKVAIVTGGSKGLGLASARALAAEGAHVVICGRTPRTLDDAAAALAGVAGDASRVLAVQADVSSEADLRRLVDETTARFGEGQSHRMSADSVAAAYLGLTQQDRSAWTHELDLRPFSERF